MKKNNSTQEQNWQVHHNRLCLKCGKTYFVKSGDFKCPQWIDGPPHELILCHGIPIEVNKNKYPHLQEKENSDEYDEDFQY